MHTPADTHLRNTRIRQFSLRDLLLFVIAFALLLGCWRAFGLKVLLSTLVAAVFACGVGALIGRITARRRAAILGGIVGIFVAHVAVIAGYYMSPYTDIHN